MTELAPPPSSVPRSAIRRIFLSSTFVDLQAHRVAVHDMIERMGHFTIGMERFGAQDGDAQSVSLKQLAAADLYVGVIAWRYGFIPPDQPLSVTQQEYQEATRLKQLSRRKGSRTALQGSWRCVMPPTACSIFR